MNEQQEREYVLEREVEELKQSLARAKALLKRAHVWLGDSTTALNIEITAFLKDTQ